MCEAFHVAPRSHSIRLLALHLPPLDVLHAFPRVSLNLAPVRPRPVCIVLIRCLYELAPVLYLVSLLLLDVLLKLQNLLLALSALLLLF